MIILTNGKLKTCQKPPLKNDQTQKTNLLFEPNQKQNSRFKDDFVFALGCLTVCVTCVWVGVDSVWGEENAEARKMLLNRADSHMSGTRFVGRLCARHADWKPKPHHKTQTSTATDKIIARTSLFRKNQNPHAKLLRKRLDPGTELKFTKTFAEETQPVLNTQFDQTRFYFNETQTMTETLKKPNTKCSRRKEFMPKWLDQKTRQITANDN